MKVNFDEQGNIERIHPAPGERCNLDDAKNVREMALVDLLVAVAAWAWHRRYRRLLSMEAEVRALVCETCGG